MGCMNGRLKRRDFLKACAGLGLQLLAAANSSCRSPSTLSVAPSAEAAKEFDDSLFDESYLKRIRGPRWLEISSYKSGPSEQREVGRTHVYLERSPITIEITHARDTPATLQSLLLLLGAQEPGYVRISLYAILPGQSDPRLLSVNEHAVEDTGIALYELPLSFTEEARSSDPNRHLAHGYLMRPGETATVKVEQASGKLRVFGSLDEQGNFVGTHSGLGLSPGILIISDSNASGAFAELKYPRTDPRNMSLSYPSFLHTLELPVAVWARGGGTTEDVFTSAGDGPGIVPEVTAADVRGVSESQVAPIDYLARSGADLFYVGLGDNDSKEGRLSEQQFEHNMTMIVEGLLQAGNRNIAVGSPIIGLDLPGDSYYEASGYSTARARVYGGITRNVVRQISQNHPNERVVFVNTMGDLRSERPYVLDGMDLRITEDDFVADWDRYLHLDASGHEKMGRYLSYVLHQAFAI